MTVSRFSIPRMDCAAEEQLVEMALAGIDTINHIEIDLDQRVVAVDHDASPRIIDDALRRLDLGSTHLDDHDGTLVPNTDQRSERPALVFAFIVNAAFFVGELTVGLWSRSMGLIADALDMGADASVYALSLAAVGTSVARKNQLARTSGYLQLTLAFVGLAEVIRRFIAIDQPPETTSMIAMSVLALAGNVAVLVALQRVRTGEAHLQASWIFTANDIKVNLLVIIAAIAVAFTDSVAPDLIAGAIIFVVVANGARRILNITR